jgi:hypothetical protein
MVATEWVVRAAITARSLIVSSLMMASEGTYMVESEGTLHIVPNW